MTGLKDQCFGVEVEMTGITRKQAAQALADYFGTVPKAKGGVYDTWKVKDPTGKEWKLVSDASIIGEQWTGTEYLENDIKDFRVELVTPKLTYPELPKLQECMRRLKQIGAKVNDSCGIHVHVDAANHNRQSLKNLISIMYSKEDILFKALQVNEVRAIRFCKKVREPMMMCSTMKKETYKIPCPKHIVFGDPLYFEEFKGRKLQSLVVDYTPPQHFEARLVLLEEKSEELDGFVERSINLYLAPAETMKTYLDEMKYKDQKVAQKMIGVDTARYVLEIDDHSDEIYTGGDGCWGNEVELYRRIGNQRVSDAMIISVAMPEGTDFDGMRERARYFFPDLQQVDRGGKKKKRGDAAR